MSATVKPAVCPLDCPDTCSLAVTVENNAITKVTGSRVNPLTGGVVCNKVARYAPDWVHGPRRLRTPLIKQGEGFRRAGWDEALALIAARTQAAMAEHGAETVLPLNYGGPQGQLSAASMDRRFFHALGATQVQRGPLCGGVRGAAYASLFGTAPGMPVEYAVDADVIAVWGSNVTVSNLHFARLIKQARARGARLVVVDPKRTRIAEQAQCYLQIKPGADVVLALALAAEFERRGVLATAFIERWVSGAAAFLDVARQYSLADAARLCAVPLSAVTQLADVYCTARNLALSVGNGIERSRCGGSSLRAIMSLNALLGQFGRRGAGVMVKPGLSFPATPERLQRPDLMPAGARTINILDVGRHLLQDDLTPPIRAAFIFNHNPVATHPDQNRLRRALSRPEIFKVGIDVTMTDSLAYCDVVLPACSAFETDDLYCAYGHGYLQRAEPVIPPVGEALPNTEIFRRLAKAFGIADPLLQDDDAALMDAALRGDDDRLAGWAPSRTPVDAALPMQSVRGEQPLLCGNLKPGTASGVIELFSAALEAQHGYGVPRYEPVTGEHPFVVISPSSAKRTNATLGGHPDSAGPECVEMHPADAARQGLQDGQAVVLGNALGEVALTLKITDAVAPGVLYSPKGAWLHSSATGQTVNALISADRRTDIADGACYNDTFVEVRAAV